MEESKLKKILLIIAGILLILFLVGIVYFLFFYDMSSNKTSPTPTEQDQKQENNNKLETSPDESPQEQPDNNTQSTTTTSTSFNDKKEFTERDVKKMASSFVERFGSYSNHSQFSNLKDLQMFMTEDMSDWAEDYVEEQNQKEYSGNYYGITTNVISSQVENLDQDQGEAKVVLTTQRIENKEKTQKENIFTQKIDVELDRVNGEWKIDSAKWRSTP